MFLVFFTQILSFTRASDFCSYEIFKVALRGSGDLYDRQSKQMFSSGRTWTPLH